MAVAPARLSKGLCKVARISRHQASRSFRVSGVPSPRCGNPPATATTSVRYSDPAGAPQLSAHPLEGRCIQQPTRLGSASVDRDSRNPLPANNGSGVSPVDASKRTPKTPGGRSSKAGSGFAGADHIGGLQGPPWGNTYSTAKAATHARPSGVMRKRWFRLVGFSGIVISIRPFFKHGSTSAFLTWPQLRPKASLIS